MICFNALKRWTRQQRDHRLLLGVCTLALVKKLQRRIRGELALFKRRCLGEHKVRFSLSRVGHLLQSEGRLSSPGLDQALPSRQETILDQNSSTCAKTSFKKRNADMLQPTFERSALIMKGLAALRRREKGQLIGRSLQSTLLANFFSALEAKVTKIKERVLFAMQSKSIISKSEVAGQYNGLHDKRSIKNLEIETKSKSQTATPLTQVSSTAQKPSEIAISSPQVMSQKSQGLLMGAEVTKALILNSFRVAASTKKKTQTTKQANKKGHRSSQLFFVANKFLVRVARQALTDFRVHCGLVTLGSRLQMVRELATLEQEIESLKDQLEAKTYSAYNSNTNKGYHSLTGDLALVAHDDSKVSSAHQEMIESSRNIKDELTLSYLHFVEHQNAELREQRDKQADELAQLKREFKEVQSSLSSQFIQPRFNR